MINSNKDEEQLTRYKNERTKISILLISVVIGLWLLTWYLVPLFIDDPGDRGTFGDMFGSVNSLFSGLALAGIIYTIYVQKMELRLQRKELQMAREELSRQAAAQEQSGEALKEQVDAFRNISKFIEMSITTTRNLNTSRMTGAILNSKDKIRVRKIFKTDDATHSIPVELIDQKIEKDASIEDSLQKLLSSYDELCLGLQQNVYDEGLIRSSCEQPLIDTYILFKEYILHIRNDGHPHAWLHFEQVVKKWQKEESELSLN